MHIYFSEYENGIFVFNVFLHMQNISNVFPLTKSMRTPTILRDFVHHKERRGTLVAEGETFADYLIWHCSQPLGGKKILIWSHLLHGAVDQRIYGVESKDKICELKIFHVYFG